jgi:hypothetical protein
VSVVQPIAGAVGFIINQVQPDAHFGICVLALYLIETRMTQRAFD